MLLSEMPPRKISEEPGVPSDAGSDKASGKNQKEVKMTEQEIADLKARADKAEKEKAEALKFGEEEKSKRVALELKGKEARIASFCEAHKETLTPALQPKFKALALAQSSAVKFDDKEVEPLEAFLIFAEDLLKAKKVDLSETKDGDKDDTDAAKKLGDQYKGNGKDEIRNADLAAQAEKYAEEHTVPYRDALLICSQKNKEGK
jgi:hypothetical protein